MVHLCNTCVKIKNLCLNMTSLYLYWLLKYEQFKYMKRFWKVQEIWKRKTKNAKDMPKRIYHCYFDRKRNVRHFFLEIILRSRTSRILDRYEERGSIESKKNIGILVTLLSVVFLHNVYYKNKIQLYKVKTRPIQEHVSIFVFCSF